MKKIVTLVFVFMGTANLYAQMVPPYDQTPEYLIPRAVPPVDQIPYNGYVQQKAEFPGDEDKWIADHIQYPDSERNAHIEGIVYVDFMIEKDSSISQVRLLRGVSLSLNWEALRVVRAMPKWKPAMQDGKPIKVRETTLVRFLIKK